MNVSKELLEKAKAAKSAEELLALARKKSEETLERMMSGEMTASPAGRKKNRPACEYCDYTVLCQSELSPKPNKLPSLSGREVWERLREEEDLTPPDRTDS